MTVSSMKILNYLSTNFEKIADSREIGLSIQVMKMTMTRAIAIIKIKTKKRTNRNFLHLRIIKANQ
jgi:hypothetical protein